MKHKPVDVTNITLVTKRGLSPFYFAFSKTGKGKALNSLLMNHVLLFFEQLEFQVITIYSNKRNAGFRKAPKAKVLCVFFLQRKIVGAVSLRFV